MAISSSDFNAISQLVRQRAGIVLEPGKEYLVESRLLPLARAEGFASLADLVAELRRLPTNRLHDKVVEAMTTNETSFFRDVHPFETLRTTIIPQLLSRRATERRLRFWCAACSSGQEPYSIALVLREYFPQLSQWEVSILATDISESMLSRARAGCYTQLEVNRGLPAALLVKYFQRQGMMWQVKEEVRRLVEFRSLNLMDSWSLLPPMDIIFMRNVLIYFDVETKKTILGKVRRSLRPDGYLFLGGAETTTNLDEGYEVVRFDKTVCYQPRRM